MRHLPENVQNLYPKSPVFKRGPGIQMPALICRCMGRTSLMNSILSSLQVTLPRYQADLREALKAGDTKHLGLVSRRLGVCAANICATSLHISAIDLVLLCQGDTTPAELAALTEAVCEEIDRCLIVIDNPYRAAPAPLAKAA